MELDLYLKPVDFSRFKLAPWTQKKFTLGPLLEKNREKLPLNKARIVIIGVEEDRNSVVPGSCESPDKIREYLYSLNRIAPRFKILDLGNINCGSTPNDTYFALRDVCRELIDMGITVVVLGGSQDLTFGITKAFEDRLFSLVNIDPMLDFRKGDKAIDSENYLNFVFKRPSTLYSHATLGYQNYFVDSLELQHASDLDTETKRLGQLRYNMGIIEPYMRSADIVSFDLNAVRQLEAPAQYFVSPNGFYAEEACQVAHYAGIGDHVKIGGFFNLIPRLDSGDLSSKLMAQIVWHFIEGFFCRIVEDPVEGNSEFKEFIVDLDDVDMELHFYQSRRTGRWWMKIFNEHNDTDLMVPCTQEDYDMAARYEVPDRWWRNVRKLSRRTR
ncbi:MAG: formimidoylglutamase [Prolixibacteraceae bacterium]